MELESVLGQLGRPIQVFFVDLMLAGDNALMVALVCRSLPSQYLRQAMIVGTTGAIALRFAMSAAAITILTLPAVKLVGAALLIIIALNLVQPDLATDEEMAGPPAIASFLAACILLAVVDFIMSVDNIVALAAVAQGSVLYLGLGLLLSIPFLVAGNALMTALLRRHPGLVLLGGAVLGWVAGGMVVSDALTAGWVANEAPALATAVPALMAIYVLAVGRTAPSAEPVSRKRQNPPPMPASRPQRPLAAESAEAPKPAPQLAVTLPVGETTFRERRRDIVLFLIAFAVAGGALLLMAILGSTIID